MTAFLASLGLVVLAEMGDKTQLLAMAFAVRFRWQTVLWGVFAATAANHLLAVEAGRLLPLLVPLVWVKTAAAASFIIFGLWTLHGDELHGEDRRFSFSPFWTVAVAFFLAEMGDKTQLATMVLAAEYRTVLPVWLGTTSGMLIADAAGIIVGVTLGKRIPQHLMKWLAALIFIGFGLLGLRESLPAGFWSPPRTIAGLLLLALLIILFVRPGRKNPALVRSRT